MADYHKLNVLKIRNMLNQSKKIYFSCSKKIKKQSRNENFTSVSTIKRTGHVLFEGMERINKSTR